MSFAEDAYEVVIDRVIDEYFELTHIDCISWDSFSITGYPYSEANYQWVTAEDKLS